MSLGVGCSDLGGRVGDLVLVLGFHDRGRRLVRSEEEVLSDLGPVGDDAVECRRDRRATVITRM